MNRSVLTGGLCQTTHGDLLVNASLVDAVESTGYVFADEGRGLKRRLGLIRGTDGGRLWTAPEYYPPDPFEFAGIITGPLPLSVDAIFMPHSVKTAAGVLGTGARLSRDDGATFGGMELCFHDPLGHLNFCDSYFTVLPDGELLSLIWTFTHPDSRKVNLHQSKSKDGERIWSHVATVLFSLFITPCLRTSFTCAPADSVIYYETREPAQYSLDSE